METFVLIIGFILSLCIIIILHELGHLIVAKILGVEIEEFGIFLPPRIKTLFTWRGTKFSINAIPFGGFVKPRMEKNGESAIEKAAPLKKVAIGLAGVIFNLLTAIVLFFAIFTLVGIPGTSSVTVYSVLAESAAANADLRVDDKIISVDGQMVTKHAEVMCIINAKYGGPIPIIVLRDGVYQELTLYRKYNQFTKFYDPIGLTLRRGFVKLDAKNALGLSISNTLGRFFPLNLTNISFEKTNYAVVNLPSGFVGLEGMYKYFEIQATQSVLPGVFRGLNFIALISISVASINILPIPILDGGKILLTLPEFFGLQLSRKSRTFVNTVGLILLVILSIWVNM